MKAEKKEGVGGRGGEWGGGGGGGGGELRVMCIHYK